jgi:TRAP-type C4-dicarboxylate transport system permease small subunit
VRFLKGLTGIFERMLNIAAFLSGALLIALMLLVCVAVVLRYFFHSPLGWSVEVSQYIFVFMGNLILAWVLWREKHVKVDILVDFLGEKSQAIVNSVTSALNTATCFILTFFAGRVTWDLYRTHYFEPTILMTPKWIFIAVITFGFFTLSVQFVRRTYVCFKILRSKA